METRRSLDLLFDEQVDPAGILALLLPVMEMWGYVTSKTCFYQSCERNRTLRGGCFCASELKYIFHMNKFLPVQFWCFFFVCVLFLTAAYLLRWSTAILLPGKEMFLLTLKPHKEDHSDEPRSLWAFWSVACYCKDVRHHIYPFVTHVNQLHVQSVCCTNFCIKIFIPLLC